MKVTRSAARQTKRNRACIKILNTKKHLQMTASSKADKKSMDPKKIYCLGLIHDSYSLYTANKVPLHEYVIYAR